MSKSVLISICPEWCKLIVDGKKTVFGLEPVSLLRPPQSWCYVEEMEGGSTE